MTVVKSASLFISTSFFPPPFTIDNTKRDICSSYLNIYPRPCSLRSPHNNQFLRANCNSVQTENRKSRIPDYAAAIHPFHVAWEEERRMIVDEFTRRILSRYCRTEAFKRPFCFTTRRVSVLFLPILDKLRENGLKSLLSGH